tara:strand:- start:11352 stop:12188 length:837 start_codon:yes stop_codon:yes gene_type:complete
MPNVHQAQYLVNEIELNKGKNPERFIFFLDILSELSQRCENENMKTAFEKCKKYRRDFNLKRLKFNISKLREGKFYILESFKDYSIYVYTHKFSNEELGVKEGEVSKLVSKLSLKFCKDLLKDSKTSLTISEVDELNKVMFLGGLTFNDIGLSSDKYNKIIEKQKLLTAMNSFIKTPTVNSLEHLNELVSLSSYKIEDVCRLVNVSRFQYQSRISFAYLAGAKACYIQALKFELDSLSNLNLIDHYLKCAGHEKMYDFIHVTECEFSRLRAALESLPT